MLDSTEFQQVAVSLVQAFSNAERHFVATHDQDHRTGVRFRKWIHDEYGLALDPARKTITSVSSDDISLVTTWVWQLTGWVDDERLIMFKLTYG
jgi:hypothetical protein